MGMLMSLITVVVPSISLVSSPSNPLGTDLGL